jgi:hypothetical protein
LGLLILPVGEMHNMLDCRRNRLEAEALDTLLTTNASKSRPSQGERCSPPESRAAAWFAIVAVRCCAACSSRCGGRYRGQAPIATTALFVAYHL